MNDMIEYLKQIRTTDQEVETKLDQLHRLRTMSEKCTSTWSDMPRNATKTNKDTSDIVVKIVMMEQEINERIDKLIDSKQRVITNIEKLNDPNHRIILSKRYLDAKSFEEIAVEMNYTWRHLMRIHRDALKAISDVI